MREREKERVYVHQLKIVVTYFHNLQVSSFISNALLCKVRVCLFTENFSIYLVNENFYRATLKRKLGRRIESMKIGIQNKQKLQLNWRLKFKILVSRFSRK